MRLEKQGNAFRRAALVAGALTLTGCVPNAYVYDDVPDLHYRSGGAPYPSAYYRAYPGYFGYAGYYGYPGYYGYAPYPPRVAYYDHDHRGDDCRHDSHRDGDGRGERDRHDRDARDRDGRDRDGKRHDDRHDRRPPDGPRVAPPASQPPPPPREPPGMRALRVQEPKATVKSPDAHKELE